MKKTMRIILKFVIPGLITLIIIGLFAVPFIAKKHINKHGKEYTGRNLSVDRIRINYFTATLSVIGFKMFEAAGNQTFLSFDTLTVDVNPFRYLSSVLEIEKIRLVKPEATIVRKDSIFNFDDIIAFFNSNTKKDTVNNPGKPVRYIIRNISLERGKLKFTDEEVNYTNIMTDLRFAVPFISYNIKDISKIGLKFYFENGGFFQAKADYNQNIGAYHADLTVSRLDISPFLPYAKDFVTIKSLSGMVDGEFHLDGNINNIDSIMFRGEGRVADFVAKDPENRKILGARVGHMVLKDSYPMKFAFNFDTIDLTEPYLFFEMKDSTNNFLNLLVDTSNSVSNDQPLDYSYRINHFKISDGLVDFRDNSYGEPFDYHFDKLAIKVDSVSSLDKWITAFTTMRLNKRGKLKGELGIDPSNPYELKVNYVVTNFQMSDLNVLSKYYVGFPILLGNMYYQGKTVITARQLSSENKLIIRNAKLGRKSGGLMNLPLKLALYLLKDVHGDITLDLPLTGDLNDPMTKIGRLIWQVIKNVVVKVVASPYRALSGLMGVDPDEIRGIQFNFADTTLLDGHFRRIKLFAELERKKPDLKIELAYYNDAELERSEIAVQEAGKLFKSSLGADYKKEMVRFTSFLAEKLRSDTISVISGSTWLIGKHKLDSIQESYSRLRIRKIESALHNINDSTRIKVLIPNREAPENVGSKPVFELKFSMDE